MKHDYVLQGGGCKLRPVTKQDAAFLVDLRNQPFTKGYINTTSLSLDDQLTWIKNYENRDGDYYWIIENIEGRSVGAHGLYNIKNGEGTPGRWVMFPDADIFAVIPIYLIDCFAFETLRLNRLVFDVVSTNDRVIKYHRIYGAKELHTQKNAHVIDGVSVDFVWFEKTFEMWSTLKRKWAPFLSQWVVTQIK